jgi:hypothetical protein
VTMTFPNRWDGPQDREKRVCLKSCLSEHIVYWLKDLSVCVPKGG